jgi:menaquinone-9 beta-reductase
VLADAAAAAGAEFVFGSTLGELRHDDQGHVRGAHVRDERGARWISAPLVIGADGLHSRVARRAGAANLLSGASTAANLYSYWEGLDLAGYEWRYDATSSVGAIPTNDGLACVFVSVPDRELTRVARPTATAGYEHFLRTRFAPFAERLAGARRVEPVRGFGGHRGFLKQSAGPGWALVGDAGYFKDPITAHGITDALRDAELLARAILAGSQDALDNYHALRHDLSQELFAITDRIASFTWREDELQALHRGFSREMAREQRALAALEPFSWQSPLVNVPVAV